MKKQSILEIVDQEYKKDKARHPTFPNHIVAQSAKVSAESGVLNMMCLNSKYNGKNNKKKVEKQAAKVISQAIRFIENLK